MHKEVLEVSTSETGDFNGRSNTISETVMVQSDEYCISSQKSVVKDFSSDARCSVECNISNQKVIYQEGDSHGISQEKVSRVEVVDFVRNRCQTSEEAPLPSNSHVPLPNDPDQELKRLANEVKVENPFLPNRLRNSQVESEYSKDEQFCFSDTEITSVEIKQEMPISNAGGLIGPYSGGARKLYVGNLHFNMTEYQLRQVFESFGAVELVQLPLDESGHCKGFGFVQFAELEHAGAAQSLNGKLEIAGKMIKVSVVSDQAGTQDAEANAPDFDDDEGGGMTLSAQSRALLMQKLDRSGTITSVTGALVTPSVSTPLLAVPTSSVRAAPPVATPLLPPTIPVLAGLQAQDMTIAPLLNPPEIVGAPSECLLLKNMFDPTVETEPDFDLEIKEDVQDECSEFGKVKHIFVDKNSAGHVYMRFESVHSAVGAQRSLHGRWFAGKQISATFMLPQSYDAKFPQE